MEPTSTLSRIFRFLADRSLKQILMTVAENGPLRLSRKIIGLWVDEQFDKKYNVNTCGSTQLKNLTISSENKDSGVVYDPIPHKTFDSLLKRLPDDLGDYVFVDFGSGKGRTLLIASSSNFRKIMGVEFAKELHEIALSNIASYKNKDQRCFSIESVHMDAVLFRIPEEKAVFFFFVPFSQGILSQVLKNIERSYLAHPRMMFVLFVSVPAVYPIPFDLFEASGFLHRVAGQALPFDFARRWPLEYVIYETRSVQA